jgi:hypothetical protein
MLEPAAKAVVSRWFNPGTRLNVPAVEINVTHRAVVFRVLTDVGSWRPVAQASIDVTVRDVQGVLMASDYESDVQRGKWVKGMKGQTTLLPEEESAYAQVIYRAMLAALDKAMEETAAQLRSRK